MLWFNKTKKRKLRRVIVHFNDLRSGKESQEEIVIPDGCTFKHGFTQHPRIINDRGQTVHSYDWQPGFGASYEFEYAPEEASTTPKVALLKWLCAWGSLCDGVVGILTLGLYMPSCQLRAAKRLSRARYDALGQ